jgi:hypothetical protein
VQQHVATLHFAGQVPVRWFTELDALADKTAKVLAHSLHRVVVDVCAAIVQGITCGSTIPAWFIHVLVGDGVNTNQAAAGLLLAWIRKPELPGGLRYFLILAKCSNHQVHLALSSAVCGRAAELSAQHLSAYSVLSTAQRVVCSKQHKAQKQICGAIVRLFKFLVSDYYTQFCGNLQVKCGK